MIKGGRARIGETLFVAMPDRAIEVELVEPAFYDPKGERLNA